MCLRDRTGAHSWAQDIRRKVGAPSGQFSPVLLCNFTPVLTGIIGHARVRPEWSRHVHRLTASVWYPIRERNPEAIRPEPLEGYIWVEVHGRLEHIWLEHVEVRRIGETP